MRILFAFAMLASLIFIFTNTREKEPKGILETVLDTMPETNSDFVFRHPAKIITEFHKDQMGKIVETRRGFSETDELISEESYLNGVKYGEHKLFQDKVLRLSSYYFDQKGHWPISIKYSSEGKVVGASCREGVFFTDEHRRVCGFDAPFSVVSEATKEENTFEKGISIKGKKYHANGALWLEHRRESGKYFEKHYSVKGILQSQFVMTKEKREKQKFDEEGRQTEKWTYIFGNKPYREEVVVYNQAGNEESQWSVAKKGFAVESCSLMRSIVSTPRKPELCP